MAQYYRQNIKMLFMMDTFLAATDGQQLKYYMCNKHKWSLEEYKEYVDIYLSILVEEGNIPEPMMSSTNILNNNR